MINSLRRSPEAQGPLDQRILDAKAARQAAFAALTKGYSVPQAAKESHLDPFNTAIEV